MPFCYCTTWKKNQTSIFSMFLIFAITAAASAPHLHCMYGLTALRGLHCIVKNKVSLRGLILQSTCHTLQIATRLLTLFTDPESGMLGLSELHPLPPLCCPQVLPLVASIEHKLQKLSVGDNVVTCFKGGYTACIPYVNSDWSENFLHEYILFCLYMTRLSIFKALWDPSLATKRALAQSTCIQTCKISFYFHSPMTLKMDQDH